MTDTKTIMDTSPHSDISSHTGRPGLSFDASAYTEYYADFEMTEAEWVELLETLWPIMVAFSDYGMGMHPLQLVLGLPVALENLAPDSGDMLAFNSNSDKNSNDMGANGLHGRNAAGADS